MRKRKRENEESHPSRNKEKDDSQRTRHVLPRRPTDCIVISLSSQTVRDTTPCHVMGRDLSSSKQWISILRTLPDLLPPGNMHPFLELLQCPKLPMTKALYLIHRVKTNRPSPANRPAASRASAGNIISYPRRAPAGSLALAGASEEAVHRPLPRRPVVRDIFLASVG